MELFATLINSLQMLINATKTPSKMFQWLQIHSCRLTEKYTDLLYELHELYKLYSINLFKFAVDGNIDINAF